EGLLPDREGGEILMQVKHLSEAKPYEAPNHRAYCSLRLFGLDVGGPKQFTVGLSHFLPGGGAGPDASPMEKVYYVLEGELTLIAGGKQTVLKANDSCFIGPNESRDASNSHGRGIPQKSALLVRHSRQERNCHRRHRGLWRARGQGARGRGCQCRALRQQRRGTEKSRG